MWGRCGIGGCGSSRYCRSEVATVVMALTPVSRVGSGQGLEVAGVQAGEVLAGGLGGGELCGVHGAEPEEGDGDLARRGRRRRRLRCP